eukprot:COSAG06_NODE_32237_length_509_cov_0.919512_2_plen_20_part_01
MRRQLQYACGDCEKAEGARD